MRRCCTKCSVWPGAIPSGSGEQPVRRLWPTVALLRRANGSPSDERGR